MDEVRSPFHGGAVRLSHVATLEPPGALDRLDSVTVGPAGQAVAVWTDTAGLQALGFVDDGGYDQTGPMEGRPRTWRSPCRHHRRRRPSRSPASAAGASPLNRFLTQGSCSWD